MARRPRFVMSRTFGQELARDPGVQAIVDAAAEDAGKAARQIASTFANTGAFEASIEVDGNVLLTRDPAGHLIEFGSENNPVYAPLRRAAEQVGAKVVDDGA